MEHIRVFHIADVSGDGQLNGKVPRTASHPLIRSREVGPNLGQDCFLQDLGSPAESVGEQPDRGAIRRAVFLGWVELDFARPNPPVVSFVSASCSKQCPPPPILRAGGSSFSDSLIERGENIDL